MVLAVNKFVPVLKTASVITSLETAYVGRVTVVDTAGEVRSQPLT